MYLAEKSGDADWSRAWRLGGAYSVQQKPFAPDTMLTLIGRIFESIDEKKEEAKDGVE